METRRTGLYRAKLTLLLCLHVKPLITVVTAIEWQTIIIDSGQLLQSFVHIIIVQIKVFHHHHHRTNQSIFRKYFAVFISN